MASLDNLYILLPIILYPLSTVILTKIARKKGSLKLALARQIAIFIAGIPLFFVFDFPINILTKYTPNIILAGMAGGVYLYTNYIGFNHLPVAIARIYATIVRVVLAVAIGIILFNETLSFWQYVGIILITAGAVFLRPKSVNTKHLKNANPALGAMLAIVAGVLFTISQYFFKKFPAQIHPVTAGYLLEMSVGITLLVLFCFSKNKTNQTFDKKDYAIILAVSPLVILASAGTAKALQVMDFSIVNTLFGFILVLSMVFSWIFLKEKLTWKQVIVFLVMVIGIGFLKL